MTPHIHAGESPYPPLTLANQGAPDRSASQTTRPGRRGAARPPVQAARWLALLVASVPGLVLAVAVLLFSVVAVLLLTAARTCVAIRFPRLPYRS